MTTAALIKNEQLKNVRTLSELTEFIEGLKPNFWIRKKRPTWHSGKSLCALIYETEGRIHYMWDDGATSGSCKIGQLKRVIEICEVEEDFYILNNGIVTEFKTGVPVYGN